ncbi:MAG: SDR family NAD(P)-dependent oxidoreductase, partial [Ilumatobacteraceae bacterium]
MASFPFRTALITGASAGIGEAMSRMLGDAGLACVVVARRDDRLRELAAAYSNFEVLAADLTTDEGVRLVEERIGDA